jgi:phage shock protein PspC (stress-responsive transcriptional regulator)
MNEVNRIHLGRQPFTVSVEAHKELKEYLAAIKKQGVDKDVLDEIELRMAELLTEKGISADKVVLAKDVDFLKEQLGNPKDFKEDEDSPQATVNELGQKRLFRDTENAMVAGVAAGLASYFGIDVLLVRILFVVGAITGGWGILLYIALWLLVPEAKTSSERLQMQGKPVTVEGLKEIVDRADVKGAAHRANNTITPTINKIFGAILKFIGIGFILAGLAALFGLIATTVYMAIHNGQLFEENLFPVGTSEHLLLYIGIFLAAVVSLFIILFGLAMFRRKWPIGAWVTGTLVGLAFIGLATGAALAGDAVPKVRDRYNAQVHTVTRPVEAFDTVNVLGDSVSARYQYAETYSVTMRYFGDQDVSAKIKTSVKNHILQIDGRQFDWRRHCDRLCLFNTYNMELTVKGPNSPRVNYPDSSGTFIFPPGPPPNYQY